MNDCCKNQLITELDLKFGNVKYRCVYMYDGEFDGLSSINSSFLNRIDTYCKLHRSNGPAVIFSDGSKQWFSNDKLHSVIGPAIVCHDGYMVWRVNNEFVRTMMYE